MSYSVFGKRLSTDAAIVDLMADLGHALNVNPDMLFLGGGNPAHIPEFERLIAGYLKEIADDEVLLHRVLGIYQSPQGAESLLESLAAYFQTLGWPVTEENICVTNGSQSAFFMLINMLAGEGSDGQDRHICLPLVPEYLGYADQGLHPDSFLCNKPLVELIGEHEFRYTVDFENLRIDKNSAAICLSRPTNPSGNVLSKYDLTRLGSIADENAIPLIIDCAYGAPFPNLIYSGESVAWSSNRIYVLSLSKLGLPGLRTGIVVADPEVIRALTSANTVLSLASGNLGPQILTKMLAAGTLDRVCKEMLLPFYGNKRQQVLSLLQQHLDGLPYRVHKADGAFFVWLWFKGLPVSSAELYRRLKSKGVLVMDGEHFFFDQFPDWPHAKECIRLSYCAPEPVLDQALQILAQELKSLTW